MTHTVESLEQDIANAVFKESGLVLHKSHLDNYDVGFVINTENLYHGNSYRPYKRNVVTATVNKWNYGAKTYTFRMRKNGTFNIAKIVERLTEARSKIIAEHRRAVQNSNSRANAEEQRRSALSILGGNRSEYSSTVEVTRYNSLSSKITLAANAENAEKLAKILAYAEELGVSV